MTRIIAGRYKGSRLSAPSGSAVRPTTDRMRERLFSVLMHGPYPDINNARVADLFAGTGAIGLEALSRGASTITFVEKSPASVACIKENIAALDAENETRVLRISALDLPTISAPFDIIFMDPPYHKGLVEPTLESLLSREWIATDGVVICELGSDETPTIPRGLTLENERLQGKQKTLFLTYTSTS